MRPTSTLILDIILMDLTKKLKESHNKYVTKLATKDGYYKLFLMSEKKIKEGIHNFEESKNYKYKITYQILEEGIQISVSYDNLADAFLNYF